jgi:acyl-homoserine lactone acylase PvdQ
LDKEVGSRVARIAVFMGVLGALAFTASSASASPPAADPYGTNDFGGFRNILPPGENGFTTAADYLTGNRPPHNNDQWNMYGDLVYDVGHIDETTVDDSYKDATYGVQPGHVADTYTPNCAVISTPSANNPHCDDVTIVRDTDFGVPHIYGTDRAAALFGSGYAAAEDRLFFMDVERHLGRGTMASFLGGSNAAQDRSLFASAPYSEADLQTQYDNLDDVLGADGEQGQEDVQNYVDGINQYIAEARVGPNVGAPGTMIPGEYLLATNSPGGPDAWQVTDVVATATLVGGQFGKGGGSEINSALALQAAQDQFGETGGRTVWEDFREREDSEAPTTVHNGMTFPYGQAPDDPSTVAMPDPGTLEDQPVVESKKKKAQPKAAHKPVMRGMLKHDSASNALLVSDAQTTFDHPIAVMGPQVGYYSPQILMEQDIHAPSSGEGPALDSRGVGFAGVSLYVLLGHGDDYAWSATSAGQDIIDNYALELCDPNNPGDPGEIDDDGYRFDGDCLPFEEVTRTDTWVPTPQDPTPAGSQTMTALRTKLGIVRKRGDVDGTPMAFTELRSTYFHDLDSAAGFADYNSPDKVNSPATFEDAASKIGFTFNWFYADDQHIAYYNSGDNPVRPDGVSGDLPVRATPEDTLDNVWEGYNPDTRQADVTPFGQHPNVVDQDYISSWNNKQAPGFNAADDTWSYGSVHRVDSLNERIEKGISGSNTMTRAELVNAMESAGTVDLRGSQVLGTAIDVIKQGGAKLGDGQKKAIKTLRDWIKKGAHRRDKDNNGAYEMAKAIRMADAWWPELLQAEFEPTLGTDLYDAVKNVMDIDDPPARGGSSYISGWYGYVDKDLRTLLGEPVSDPFSRVYCGDGKLKKCSKNLAASLKTALAHDSSDELYGTNTCVTSHDFVAKPQWCHDAIRPTTVGVWAQAPIHWINRPTFQQVVEVQDHR